MEGQRTDFSTQAPVLQQLTSVPELSPSLTTSDRGDVTRLMGRLEDILMTTDYYSKVNKNNNAELIEVLASTTPPPSYLFSLIRAIRVQNLSEEEKREVVFKSLRSIAYQVECGQSLPTFLRESFS